MERWSSGHPVFLQVLQSLTHAMIEVLFIGFDYYQVDQSGATACAVYPAADRFGRAYKCSAWATPLRASTRRRPKPRASATSIRRS